MSRNDFVSNLRTCSLISGDSGFFIISSKRTAFTFKLLKLQISVGYTLYIIKSTSRALNWFFYFQTSANIHSSLFHHCKQVRIIFRPMYSTTAIVLRTISYPTRLFSQTLIADLEWELKWLYWKWMLKK